jgi:hypothetical protein
VYSWSYDIHFFEFNRFSDDDCSHGLSLCFKKACYIARLGMASKIQGDSGRDPNTLYHSIGLAAGFEHSTRAKQFKDGNAPGH